MEQNTFRIRAHTYIRIGVTRVGEETHLIYLSVSEKKMEMQLGEPNLLHYTQSTIFLKPQYTVDYKIRCSA